MTETEHPDVRPQGRTWRLVKPGGILHTQRVDYNTLNLMMFFILIMFFSHWMVRLARFRALVTSKPPGCIEAYCSYRTR
jgi:hypothetical protein